MTSYLSWYDGPTGDPRFGDVVLLLQGGTLTDHSSFGRSVTASGGVTLNDSTWVSNGQNTIKLAQVNFVNTTFLTWARAAELEFGTQDWTIEVAGKADTTDNTLCQLYIDGPGNNSTSLHWELQNTGVRQNHSVNFGSQLPIGLALTTPGEFYACLERVGDTLYGSIGGVVGTTQALTPGFVFDVPTQDARIGLGTGTGATWTVRVGRYRITMNGSRYGGANFTPPTTYQTS